jgi:hypothetical protein
VVVEGAQFEPIHADLVAAAMRGRRPDRALLERAAAGREAVDRGADPALTLALVVWPSEKVTAAQASTRSDHQAPRWLELKELRS